MTRAIALVALVACGGTVVPGTPPPDPNVLPSTPQRAGDARRGYEALVTANYIGCGLPRSLWDRAQREWPDHMKLERSRGADLPYFMSQVTLPSGVDVVASNCLSCHGAVLRGKLVIGLGQASQDFTAPVDMAQLGLASMLLGGDERDALLHMTSRFGALGQHIAMETIGANPADQIAAVLFAHRDPATLAWSDEARVPIPPERAIPVDVPAWWLLKKKAAMFHTGGGRGDQARMMMTASVACIEDVASARTVDAYFPDIRAYVLSLEPPPFPGPIDKDLAARGRNVFEATCSKCHGSYGPGGRYQSRIVPLDQVGTDPLLARGHGMFSDASRSWFNASFYGERARLELGPGYVPPPLDGVWATAPYLHNGSVPNLAALLDSRLRKPRTVVIRRDDKYDVGAEVGWPNAEPREGEADKRIYDTSRPGHSNSGHTFGDRLSPSDRTAVIEYLKTL